MELTKLYKEREVASLFSLVFSFLPLVSIVDDEILCLHGGIGISFSNLSQIETVPYPLESFSNNVAQDILWSDPSIKISHFGVSPRKMGTLFGIETFKTFMKNNNLKYMIRAHEHHQRGFNTLFDGRLIIIFSASNYGETNNQSSALLIQDKNVLLPLSFEPLPIFHRNFVHQDKSKIEKPKQIVTPKKQLSPLNSPNPPVIVLPGKGNIAKKCHSQGRMTPPPKKEIKK